MKNKKLKAIDKIAIGASSQIGSFFALNDSMFFIGTFDNEWFVHQGGRTRRIYINDQKQILKDNFLINHAKENPAIIHNGLITMTYYFAVVGVQKLSFTISTNKRDIQTFLLVGYINGLCLNTNKGCGATPSSDSCN